MKNTIDLVKEKNKIMALTPEKIAKMPEEKRFISRVYLRVYLSKTTVWNILGDSAPLADKIEQQIAALA